MMRVTMPRALREAGIARKLRACAALLLVLCAVSAAAAPLELQTVALNVSFVANAWPVVCPASDVAFAVGEQTTVSWRCVDSPSRMRCSLTTAAQYATDVELVALDCNRLTELPAGNPATLIFAAGFESP